MSIEHNPWSEIENIDEQHCGICLPRDEIEKYNGISYYTGNNYPAIPNNIKNISQCNSYQDNEGNKYTFVTSLARITPFHKYDLSKQTEIQNHINTILLTEIRSCTSETTSSYSINFSNQTNKDAFENIFQKMSIRNENSCIALLETFYSHELKQAKVSEECENAIISNISNIAKNGCQKLLEYIENKDSKYYDLYDFNVNQTYTECQDDKDIINASSSPIISIARVNVTNSLKDYGFAELTNNISNSISADGVFEINVDMPDKIKINGVEQEYDKANVGFAIAGAKTLLTTLTINGLKGTSNTDYGTTLPSSGTEGQLFFQISDEVYEIPAGGTTGQALIKNSNTDRDVKWGPVGGQQTPNNSVKFYPSGSTSTSANTGDAVFNTSVYVQNSVLFGAAWNDYAEYRETTTPVKAGRVVIENGDDTLSLSTERMQPGAEIVSDTFGFAIGQTEKSKTAIAAAGRVLAYPHEPRRTYRPGQPVCSGPNGTVSQMTDEEARMYPWCIIGTVSSIPEYDTWGEDNIKVDGRIWVRIR